MLTSKIADFPFAEVDSNFDDESMGGDYDAEQYFDNATARVKVVVVMTKTIN
jgi:hypothetical protein